MAVAPEAVRQDDVGSGIDETLVKRAHLVWLVDVPQLRWLACFEPHFEIVGAGRTIGEQNLSQDK